MKKLKSRGQRLLKFFHLSFACMWVGAAIVLSVKEFFVSPSGGEELYGIQSTMEFIDDFIIVPGAVGVLLTGVLYSVWTTWGWFRHRWITVKWVICAYGIAFGTYPLGPRQKGLVNISRKGTGGPDGTRICPRQEHALRFRDLSGFHVGMRRSYHAAKPWGKKPKISSSTR